MFIPIGGVFIFGHGNAKLSIMLGVINIIMGCISLAVGYSANLFPLIIFGYIFAGLGLLMVILNLGRLGKVDAENKHS